MILTVFSHSIYTVFMHEMVNFLSIAHTSLMEEVNEQR